MHLQKIFDNFHEKVPLFTTKISNDKEIICSEFRNCQKIFKNLLFMNIGTRWM